MEKFEDGLESTRLQKLVFLLTQMQKKPNYDFVPYRYGCYSYSLKADLQAMVKHDWLTTKDKSYGLNTKKKYFNELTASDQKLVDETFERYGGMKTDVITKHTYINFPYYATNSSIAEKILPERLYKRVIEARPNEEATVLFTIGYEGISLEEYLNRLIKNNVKLLVDVRRNPLSQKYGFSKKLLSGFCNRLGIEYIHIPEVGIDSSKRRELNNQADYDVLFDEYKATVLKETTENQTQILALLKKHKRIALTCFEADTCQCHRTHLAEKLKTSPVFKYELKHI
ncbi:DUF488 domain-containing protein [Salegentibacter salegens]|uniref:DUF488 domain-containing protein n=1 Tax=Salegentibacter salegens TaxID=143223 RepID=A0A1M7IPE3_9FLAO|nr:DUF488 domain-containing protein [Salegentibacter salegens]PRX39665.1 uncharacterized protein DUF488 [Salegentibacter salegens]SHM42684.1 Protein of unknown function, DUF488 [Salegentibacter salegens]